MVQFFLDRQLKLKKKLKKKLKQLGGIQSGSVKCYLNNFEDDQTNFHIYCKLLSRVFRIG